MPIRRIVSGEREDAHVLLTNRVSGISLVKPLTKETAALLAPIAIKSSDRIEISLTREGTKFLARIFSADPITGERTSSASWAARGIFPTRVPERRQVDGYCSYEFGATDTTVSVLSALWPREQILFIGEDAITTYNYLIASTLAYDNVAHIYANFKENNIIPADLRFSQNEQQPLAPYQIAAAECAIRAPEGYGLFCEQGTGKTAIAVTRICADAKRVRANLNRMYKVLVVCPKNVRANWPEEFEKFGTVPGRVTVLRGTQLDRIKLLIDAFTNPNGANYSAVIVSYETATRMMEVFKSIEWDLGLLDESHSIKSIRTKRAQASTILRDVCQKRMCLTGTPITNSALDVYTQLEFLSKGASGFQSWEAFKRFYGVFDKDPSTGYNRLIAVQNLPFMKERLARYSFIIRKEEALPYLPKKVHDVLSADMTPEQERVYDDLRKSLVAEIEAQIESGENMQLVVNHALTQLLRLAQITSGYVPLTSEALAEDGSVKVNKSIYRFNPNPKLELLVEEMKKLPSNSKAIIWCHWVNDIEQIHERLEREGIYGVQFYGKTSDDNRETAKSEFNTNPNCKYLVGNPAAGGSGLNLLGYDYNKESAEDTDGIACDREFYYSQGWSAVTRSQSEDRAHRRGTRRQVRITDVVVSGSIDEEIRNRVFKKRIDAYEISDVRAILRAVLSGVIHDE